MRVFIYVFAFVGLFLGLIEARRTSGGGSRTHGSSRPASRPSYPTYHPSPSYPTHHPSPSYPSYHPAPSQPSYNPAPSRPSYPSQPAYNPSHSTQLSYPNYNKPSQNTNTNTNNNVQKVPSNTANAPYPPPSSNTNQRPVGWDVSNSKAPSPSNTNQRPIGWNTQHNTGSTGGGNHALPPRPGPVPPPSAGTHSNTPPVAGGKSKTKIKIVNNVHNHYPGSYGIPQPSYHYPGYYHSSTYYNYGRSDTGSGALGFFLGYSLARITTPTYSHYSFYDGYRPRYDHYTVVHYHHNREQAPRDPVVQSNSIIACVGDSGSICTMNTTALCTTEGTLMCVASAISTVPCTDNRNVNCIRSSVPCVNSTAPECQNSQNNQTSLSIPCVTTAKVFGEITFVNNTIVGQNSSVPTMAAGTTTTNSPITTTLPPANSTIVSDSYHQGNGRRRRDVQSQNFCVTIVALPAKKVDSEGEKLYDSTKNLVSKFFAKAWGLE